MSKLSFKVQVVRGEAKLGTSEEIDANPTQWVTVADFFYFQEALDYAKTINHKHLTVKIVNHGDMPKPYYTTTYAPDQM